MMFRRRVSFLLAPICAAAFLSSCATAPVMHTEMQLNDVGTRCGFALGELMQDESEKRLLLIVRNAPSDAQRVCVARWARRNHLKAVFVHMDFPS
jgi:hypothetical protein